MEKPRARRVFFFPESRVRRVIDHRKRRCCDAAPKDTPTGAARALDPGAPWSESERTGRARKPFG